MNFSVLMSVYIKENPIYLKECLESLVMQTLQAPEIILVEDGPITSNLSEVIDFYYQSLPIKRIKFAQNQGLAAALNEGLRNCSHELVIRMDTDDIALPIRFKRQIDFMIANKNISVSSAWIEERDHEMHEKGFLKVLPEKHIDIIRFAKRRNPFNHPVTIFRKSAVLAVGSYPLVFPEDYALWSLMLVKGYTFANIPEVLLYMRTGEAFIDRRGLDFFKGEVGLLKFQKSIGFLNIFEFLTSLALRAAIRLPPRSIRKILYQTMR
jgi:glycosyltransferase involved in cell wall biosynthesis